MSDRVEEITGVNVASESSLGMMHPTKVGTLLIHSDRILLLESAHHEWCYPNGQIEQGESPWSCATREVYMATRGIRLPNTCTSDIKFYQHLLSRVYAMRLSNDPRSYLDNAFARYDGSQYIGYTFVAIDTLRAYLKDKNTRQLRLREEDEAVLRVVLDNIL